MVNPKQLAAEHALKLVESGMCVGLGTGSTARYFIAALGRAFRAGEIRDIHGVPTSLASQQLALEHGVPLADPSRPFVCDLTIDGADEIDPELNLIKGLGGALVREKVVAQNSRRFVVIADATKRVSRLGSRSPLPVEVLEFGLPTYVRFLEGLGAKPTLRKTPDAQTYRTDNGHLILDCDIREVADIRLLARDLNGRSGIIGHGLFLDLADLAIVSDDAGHLATITRGACGGDE